MQLFPYIFGRKIMKCRLFSASKIIKDDKWVTITSNILYFDGRM